MARETPDPPKEEDGPAPPSSRRTSDLSSLVKECRVYLYERDVQRGGGVPSQSSPVSRLFSMQWRLLSRLGDAIAGLLLAAVNLISSLLPSGSAIGRFTRSRLVWGVTALCTFSIVGVLIYESATEQRRHATAIEQMAAQFRSLRDRSAEEAVWKEFATQAHERLSELVPELEQAAAANDRTSIDLLWAARDYLPQMLTDARKSPSEAERQFNVCMQRVRRHLDRTKP